MAKFHINPETGEPGVCTALKQCRYGENAAHYESEEEARLGYESAQEVFQAPQSYGMAVVGDIDKDGFVASTYPSYKDWSPSPVKAVIKDEATGKEGFVAARPRQGSVVHVMRDNPRWRQGMGPGKLIIYNRSICGRAGKGGGSSSMLVGGHENPTPPSQALADSKYACAACAKKLADPNYV